MTLQPETSKLGERAARELKGNFNYLPSILQEFPKEMPYLELKLIELID